MKKFAFIKEISPSDQEKLVAMEHGIELIHVWSGSMHRNCQPSDINGAGHVFDGVITNDPVNALTLVPFFEVGVLEIDPSYVEKVKLFSDPNEFIEEPLSRGKLLLFPRNGEPPSWTRLFYCHIPGVLTKEVTVSPDREYIFREHYATSNPSAWLCDETEAKVLLPKWINEGLAEE